MYSIDDILTDVLYEKNHNNFEDLKKDIENNNICFILGAGVSKSMEFPNWQELLAMSIGRLLYTFNKTIFDKKTFDKEKFKDLGIIHKKALNEKEKCEKGNKGEYTSVLDKFNLLEIAEYILNYHIERLPHDNKEVKIGIAEKQFLSLVHDCLYHNESELEKLYNKEYSGSTLEAVVNVIKNKFDKKREQIVITYNYDNLIEYSLAKYHPTIKDKIKTISYSGRSDEEIRTNKKEKEVSKEELKRYKKKYRKIEKNKINICHMHGYTDVTKREEVCDRLVLSEKSYYDVEENEYDWINTYQASTMQNYSCVLVGFSAEDTNFRRIIRKNGDGESYIFFTVDDIVKAVFSEQIDDSIKQKNLTREEKAKEVNKKIDEIIKDKTDYPYEMLMIILLIYSKTKYWENKNVHAIWTTISELPEKINELIN